MSVPQRISSCLNKIILIGITIIAVVVMAAISFQVRELAAALLLFSVVFGAIGTALLLLMLAEEVASRAIARIATGLFSHIREPRTFFHGALASVHQPKSH